MKTPKYLSTFRLHNYTRERVKELAEKYEFSEAEIVEIAVNELYNNKKTLESTFRYISRHSD